MCHTMLRVERYTVHGKFHVDNMKAYAAVQKYKGLILIWHLWRFGNEHDIVSV